MSDSVIKVENLSKQYILSHESKGMGGRFKYRRFSDALIHAAQVPFHFFKKDHAPALTHEEFWALKGVSFEIKRGEVVGIIGRNGAGKSTLLKILSRITEPTGGRIEIDGRVASLLEVGTGFHPELTGRENIYLNGAVLGMNRSEIKRKFEEIVAFAEVEKFLDTPVKHFSSGMYMRLAFAVAAHLEPEILVVDEVLAVGDTEFQKKCLGKMGEVAKGGRTVLFVSHNMAAVKSLTSRALVLKRGELAFNGHTDDAIRFYADSMNQPVLENLKPWGSGHHASIKSVQLLDETDAPTGRYVPGKLLRLGVTLETDGTSSLSLETFLVDATRSRIGLSSLYQFHGQMLPTSPGIYNLVLNLEPLWLASGFYAIDMTTSLINTNWDHYVESAVEFEVEYFNPGGLSYDFKQTFGFGSLALLLSEPVAFSKSVGP